MLTFCRRCGVNYEEADGKDHRVCGPKNVVNATKPVVNKWIPIDEVVARSEANPERADAMKEAREWVGGLKRKPVSLGAYTPGCGAPVATKEDLAVPTTLTVSRQVSWQQANREKYNKKMRGVMKKRRAEGRAK